VEIEPRRDQPVRKPSEVEQEAAAAALREAVGDGRLTLEEFSDRVGAVWAAERTDELERVIAGVAVSPAVGSTSTVSTVVAFLGDQRRVGRWRLPARLRTFSLLGDVHLDLCAVVCAEDTVEIKAWSLMGDIDITVPDGVDVELSGFDLLGDREVRLAPVPPVPGTPRIRVTVYGLLGDVRVRSTSAVKKVPGWRRLLLGEQSPPISGQALPPPPRAEGS
jgi:hypothetical protein